MFNSSNYVFNSFNYVFNSSNYVFNSSNYVFNSSNYVFNTAQLLLINRVEMYKTSIALSLVNHITSSEMTIVRKIVCSAFKII